MVLDALFVAVFSWGAAGAAAATVLSVPENLLSGLGAADLAMQNAQKLGGVDHPANYYTPAMRLYSGSNAARTTVSEKLERSTDATIFGQNVASVAYNIGTSMMDSGATAALAAIGGIRVPGRFCGHGGHGGRQGTGH